MIGRLRYIEIDEFRLKWRFAEDASKWTVLSDADLADFHPLAEDSAWALWKQFVHPTATQLIAFVKEWGPQLQLRDTFKAADAATTAEELEWGIQFLRQHIQVPDSSHLFFFWDATCAVETKWGVFLRYWTDFCYPSDDSNVAVPVECANNVFYFEERLWIEPRRMLNRTDTH
ncbi:MAG TPA: DUF2947 family protein [Pirellulaceae bacterium]|nr:DUF2947 family protein [Pirellulaceae bacterium]